MKRNRRSTTAHNQNDADTSDVLRAVNFSRLFVTAKKIYLFLLMAFLIRPNTVTTIVAIRNLIRSIKTIYLSFQSMYRAPNGNTSKGWPRYLRAVSKVGKHDLKLLNFSRKLLSQAFENGIFSVPEKRFCNIPLHKCFFILFTNLP